MPPGHTLAQAFAGEVCAAFILMFIVCTVALDKKGDPSRIPLVMVRSRFLRLPTLISVPNRCGDTTMWRCASSQYPTRTTYRRRW